MKLRAGDTLGPYQIVARGRDWLRMLSWLDKYLGTGRELVTGFEEFNWITVGIFQLNLFTART